MSSQFRTFVWFFQKLGAKVAIGYYDQEHHVLDPDKTLFQEIQDASSVYYSPNDAASQETDRESAANSANFKEYETFFTVRAYNGSVAVFKDGNDVPLYCIETPLSSLTEEDRRLLARGIRAETLSEACKLIEDYE